MKATISLFSTLVILSLIACQSDKKPANNALPAPTPVQPLNAPVATAGMQHYICPNNCSGSGSANIGNCPTCGSEYMHNAAFHNQPGNAASNQPLAPSPILTNPQPTTAQQPAAVQTQPVDEPDQNAAGAWHYICSAGCEGGSGKRGYCAKCGAGLNHNEAYHL